jgi:hypothetical protein
MRLFVVFLVFLLQLPLHAQGVFVKEMPDGFHLSVKHALVQADILVAKSVEDATLIVTGYGRLTPRFASEPQGWDALSSVVNGKFECAAMLEFTTKDGDVVWRKSTGGFWTNPAVKKLDSCANILVWKFWKRMKKKNKDLFVVISKEPAPK